MLRLSTCDATDSLPMLAVVERVATQQRPRLDFEHLIGKGLKPGTGVDRCAGSGFPDMA
jgi:hypothetical protein